ncbi:hypothetical protein F5B22DRAFT_649679 [Xylaria bambusicola]|uniref:uncharacterized protein n=1 Tax=Xylaria bambusicola TaxID=326684 RepID=UPI0020077CFE|nr:uncharacterized protein F5B22DRAFT_649679 [Xylaria bambusicola]KAI0508784.1 hypothetical protein F5B22DRAFT_649679 [Xylaria bambusicola]
MFSKALLTAAVFGAATAQQLPAIAKRDFLESRQFDGIDPECQSALSNAVTIYSSAPTPPADLLSVTLPADPCVTPSFTGKLGSEWSSYTSAAIEWYYDHTSEINQIVTACSDVVEQIPGATDIPVCSTGSTVVVGVGSTTAAATSTPAQSSSAQVTGSSETSHITGSASHSSSGAASTGVSTSASAGGASDDASSSVSPTSTVNVPNAAPRETGFAVVAAVAAAGFMGATFETDFSAALVGVPLFQLAESFQYDSPPRRKCPSHRFANP